MADQQVDFSEILIVPIAQMIKKIGDGIAEAQKAMDTAAMESQKSLQTNFPDLAKVGYQVTWYQMPEVLVELKMALHFENTVKDNIKKTGIFLAPFNAKYQNAYTYTADGSSSLKLRIVPVPPPAAAETK